MTGAALVEYLGWAATAVFVASYFARGHLTRVQMVGALMWVGYGLLKQAPPVVAANVLVFMAAAWTLRHPRPAAVAAAPPDRTALSSRAVSLGPEDARA